MAATNYLTPAGHQKLTRELRQLAEVERPRVVQEVADAAAQGDRSENAEYIYGKKRLGEIDRRIRWLSRRLDDAQVVTGQDRQAGAIFFGASVLVEDEAGTQQRYIMVGPDEAEPTSGKISYLSPLGRALMKRRVGDVVTVERPRGAIELEVLQICYE